MRESWPCDFLSESTHTPSQNIRGTGQSKSAKASREHRTKARHRLLLAESVWWPLLQYRLLLTESTWLPFLQAQIENCIPTPSRGVGVVAAFALPTPSHGVGVAASFGNWLRFHIRRMGPPGSLARIQKKTWERPQREVEREHGQRPVVDPWLSLFVASFELSLKQGLLLSFLVKCSCGRHLLSSMPSRASTPRPSSTSAWARSFSVWGPERPLS